MLRRLALTSILFVAAMPGAAVADELTVSANVVPACTLLTTEVNFGDVDALDSETTGEGTLTVTCTLGTTWFAEANGGDNYEEFAGGGSDRRHMIAESGDKLAYELYTDRWDGTPWMDGTGATGTIEGVGEGTDTTMTIWAKVLAGQSHVRPGQYNDEVLVTLRYE